MANSELYFVSALAEDEEVISYRPKLARALSHDPEAAILLQRIARYWVAEWQGHRSRTPFYKFKDPPSRHKLYRAGDSWVEELVLTRRKFEGARNVISTKLTTGTSKSKLLSVNQVDRVEKEDGTFEDAFNDKGVLNDKVAKCLVLYWTDGERLTWYMLNEVLFESLCKRLYLYKVQTGFDSGSEVQNDLNMETSNSDVHGKDKTSVSCAYSIDGSSHEHQTHTEAKHGPPVDLYFSPVCVSDEKPGNKSQDKPSIHHIDLLTEYLVEQEKRGLLKGSVDAIARARHRDGLLDARVSRWHEQRVLNSCPDCKGTNIIQKIYWEEDGKVVSCDHRALLKSEGSA